MSGKQLLRISQEGHENPLDHLTDFSDYAKIVTANKNAYRDVQPSVGTQPVGGAKHHG